MSETHEAFDVNGTFRPCPTCDRPSLVLVEGGVEPAPGGTRIEWGDDRRTVYITPHEAGCAVAAEPNDPEGKWVTVPASVVTKQAVEIYGVRIGDPL